MDGGAAPVPGTPARVLLVTDTAVEGPGGSERFLRNLLAHLDPAEFAVDLVQLSPPPAERVATLEPRPGLSAQHWPIGAVYGRAALAAAWRLRRRVLREGHRIVQSQHEKADLLCALLPDPVRRVSNRRDTGFQRSARVQRLFRHADPRFHRIVAPTAAILDTLHREGRVEAARTRCIPNGVDTQRFAPLPPERREFGRASLGLAPDELVVGCVASYTPVKRHADLVDALARLRARDRRVRLVLVGDGPLRGAIRERVAELGLRDAVLELGARGDVDALLPLFDVFALASFTEGLSNAILEAKSCGLPVVATAVGGNPDLVRDGVDGLLVSALSPGSLADAIACYDVDPALRAVHGSAGRARVVSHHSLAAMAQAYAALYRELLR